MRVQVGSSLPSPSSPLFMCDVCGVVVCFIKKNLSLFFGALRTGVFLKEHHPLKKKKNTMGENASAFFFVVAELAVVRRPSSLHPPLLPERDRSAQLLKK